MPNLLYQFDRETLPPQATGDVGGRLTVLRARSSQRPAPRAIIGDEELSFVVASPLHVDDEFAPWRQPAQTHRYQAGLPPSTEEIFPEPATGEAGQYTVLRLGNSRRATALRLYDEDPLPTPPVIQEESSGPLVAQVIPLPPVTAFTADEIGAQLGGFYLDYDDQWVGRVQVIVWRPAMLSTDESGASLSSFALDEEQPWERQRQVIVWNAVIFSDDERGLAVSSVLGLAPIVVAVGYYQPVQAQGSFSPQHILGHYPK